MNKTVGLQLAGYSVVLAGLGFLTHTLAPAATGTTLWAALIGGLLCLVWGIRVVLGNRGKALPILTLIPVDFALLSQAVTLWSEPGTSGDRTVPVLATLLFVLSTGMLMRIAYAGEVFDGEPKTGTSREDGKKPSQTQNVSGRV